MEEINNKEDVMSKLHSLVESLSKKSNSKVRSRNRDYYGKLKLRLVQQRVQLYISLIFIQRSTGEEYTLIRKNYKFSPFDNLGDFYMAFYDELISYMHYGLEKELIFKKIKIKNNEGNEI